MENNVLFAYYHFLGSKETRTIEQCQWYTDMAMEILDEHGWNWPRSPMSHKIEQRLYEASGLKYSPVKWWQIWSRMKNLF